MPTRVVVGATRGAGSLSSLGSEDQRRGAHVADRTSTHDVAKVGGRSGDYAESAISYMTDLKEPQPGYIDMIQRGGYVEVREGFGLSFDRATTDHVLRNHQLFSSRVEMGLGNVRPLIPLNVDPPLHAKYRKLLDPLFAPSAWRRRKRTSPAGSTASSTRSSTGASAISATSSPSFCLRRCSSD